MSNFLAISIYVIGIIVFLVWFGRIFYFMNLTYKDNRRYISSVNSAIQIGLWLFIFIFFLIFWAVKFL